MGKKIIATIGSFDGVHLGHRALIDQMRLYARDEEGAEVVAVTFMPYPSDVLYPDRQREHLVTPEARDALLLEAGCDRVCVLPFERETAQMTAEEFMLSTLRDSMHVTDLFIGYDHHFGRGASLSFEDYVALGAQCQIQVHRGIRYEEEQGIISSTKIREVIRSGRVQEASRMLQRYHSIQGEVVHGIKLGTQLGYPTANLRLSPATQVIPRNGAYAARTQVIASGELRAYPVMLYIGTRPTIGGGHERSIEAHIIGFEGELYGQRLELELIDYLQPERKFASQDELRYALELYRIGTLACYAVIDGGKATDRPTLLGALTEVASGATTPLRQHLYEDMEQRVQQVKP